MGDWWLGEISGMSHEGESERGCAVNVACVLQTVLHSSFNQTLRS